METLVLIVHVFAAAAIIGLVLLQHGKGADMGAAFGSGASGSLFGASGSANFLSRTTGIVAAVFFATSMVLTYISGHKDRGGVMEHQPVQSAPAPAQGNAAPAEKLAAPAPADSNGVAPSKAKDVPQ